MESQFFSVGNRQTLHRALLRMISERFPRLPIDAQTVASQLHNSMVQVYQPLRGKNIPDSTYQELLESLNKRTVSNMLYRISQQQQQPQQPQQQPSPQQPHQRGLRQRDAGRPPPCCTRRWWGSRTGAGAWLRAAALGPWRATPSR